MQDTKQILKKVKKIEITTRHLVEGLLQGAYHSIFKGRGIEFSEVREYIPGDDIRSIDWNVTARMNTPFVKEFVEERDLTVYLVIDVSASNEFGNIKEKKETAVELAASLCFAAMHNNDGVGLCLFTKEVERFIRPRRGKKHIMKLIREMLYFKPEYKKTDLNSALVFLSNVIKKRSIIFIISDFFSEMNFEKHLRMMKRKHDVIAVNINDMREQGMPDIGYIALEDEETGEQVLIDTSNEEFQRNYKRLIENRNNELDTVFKKSKVDVIRLKSDEPFEVPLRKFFKLRLEKMVR